MPQFDLTTLTTDRLLAIQAQLRQATENPATPDALYAKVADRLGMSPDDALVAIQTELSKRN